MPQFDPRAYGPAFAALLDTDRLPELGPGTPNAEALPALRGLAIESAFAARPADANLAACCLSACWLLHDHLTESHTLSQRIETPEGSYWHGLMHRREPDFANSRYWFRLVGYHKVFDPLGIAAAELAAGLRGAPELLAAGRWDAFGFIDLCERAIGTGGELEQMCRRIARREWELLFDWCWRGAAG